MRRILLVLVIITSLLPAGCHLGCNEFVRHYQLESKRPKGRWFWQERPYTIQGYNTGEKVCWTSKKTGKLRCGTKWAYKKVYLSQDLLDGKMPGHDWMDCNTGTCVEVDPPY